MRQRQNRRHGKDKSGGPFQTNYSKGCGKSRYSYFTKGQDWFSCKGKDGKSKPNARSPFGATYIGEDWDQADEEVDDETEAVPEVDGIQFSTVFISGCDNITTEDYSEIEAADLIKCYTTDEDTCGDCNEVVKGKGV